MMVRRLSLFFAACLIAAVAVTATQASTSATDTIRHTVDNVLNIIKDPGMQDANKRPALLADVETLIKSIFDFTEFSARTVGPKWRQFTPDQKKRFTDAFEDLLRATYIERLDGYDGQQVKFLGEVSSTKGDKVEVQTTITIKNQDVPVSYRVLDKNGVWKIYDVHIEKVSLIENYRGQFKEILLKGNAEELIGKVAEKAREIQKQNAPAL